MESLIGQAFFHLACGAWLPQPTPPHPPPPAGDLRVENHFSLPPPLDASGLAG